MPELRIADPTSPAARAILRDYFAYVITRFHGQAATEAEIVEAMANEPSDDLTGDSGVFLLLRDGERIVGCGGVRFVDEGVGELTRLFVPTSERRLGHGALIVREAERIARAAGCVSLRLDTRTDLVEARALYAALGYRDVPAFNADPYAEHWLAKDLTVPHCDRLVFRRMTGADLDGMAELLGDPRVMEFYPRPKTRDEAQGWIDRSTARYADDGFGLWIIDTTDGDFVGDCGLTYQAVNGRQELEVGYHVRPELQGMGFATEAAAACRDFARDVVGATHLVTIIHPDNTASKRVAEKIGLVYEEDDLDGPIAVRSVYGAKL
jgi:RimJ/RimL family protein N-acetyltransferase